MKTILTELIEATDRSLTKGLINGQDLNYLFDHMEHLYRELYQEYTESQEAGTMAKGWIPGGIADLYDKAEKRGARKARRETALKIALRMKETDIPVAKIQTVTGLSLKAIEKL